VHQIIQQFFDFNVMGDNFDLIWIGFQKTLLLSVIAGSLSLIWGLVLSLLRQLPGRAAKPIRAVTIAYIDAFRGIPLLMILLLVNGSLGALNGDPLPQWLAVPNWLGEPYQFWYGVFAITITYGAYMAEVYRAGIESIPDGQMEAARSLGMSHGQAMRDVIVPQAVRTVIPPLLNDFIALMKDTSLVSFIGFVEVVQAGSDVYQETYNVSGLTLGAVMFLVVTIPLARVVDRLIASQQARFSRTGGGTVAQPAPAGAAGTGQTGGPV
jgi:polar amino acid transport system permease protein